MSDDGKLGGDLQPVQSIALGMRPPTKTILLTAAVLVIGTTLTWPKLRPIIFPDKSAAAAGKPAAAAPAALKVSAVTVKPEVFAETVTVTGSLRAEEGVDLQVEVSGKVVSINFLEGSNVKKGDLLLKINDTELQAMLARAVYRKQIVELKEQRIAPLLKTGGVPQQDYDAIVNDLNVQKSEIDLINAQIAKTEVRAPFDGIIGLRFVSEGAFITATSTAAARIATIQAITNLKVDFNLPEKYSGLIKVGTPITFTVTGGLNKFRGTVYAIEPRVDVATRTILLRALCPNPENTLLPGAFANVECPVASVDNAILVPSVAVVAGLSEKNVYVVQDGKAVRRPVETGTRTAASIHILSGLAPGDQVIISAIQQLRSGLAVQVSADGASTGPARASADRKKVKTKAGANPPS